MSWMDSVRETTFDCSFQELQNAIMSGEWLGTLPAKVLA